MSAIEKPSPNPFLTLAASGSIRAHAGFAAHLTLLSEGDGAAEVRTGERLVTLAQGTKVLHPLHQGTVTVALEQPVALEEGQVLAFRHHGRAAGSATVTRLLSPAQPRRLAQT